MTICIDVNVHHASSDPLILALTQMAGSLKASVVQFAAISAYIVDANTALTEITQTLGQINATLQAMNTDRAEIATAIQTINELRVKFDQVEKTVSILSPPTSTGA